MGSPVRGGAHASATLNDRSQGLSLRQHASAICWADSNYGLLDYTDSYGVDSLFEMTQLMSDAANDLRSLATGAPTTEAHAIRQVRSALTAAAAADDQILTRMPPPPGISQRLISAAAAAVASLDKVAMHNELGTCAFIVNEATVAGWATLAAPPHG